MPLPQSCGGCGFRRQGENKAPCRRHAPAITDTELALTCWPPVRDDDRCGSGDMAGVIVTCGNCQHWFLPNGEPLQPMARFGRSKDWWGNAAFCTRFAPSPSSEDHRRVYWRVTHSTDGCGDGDAVVLSVVHSPID